MPVCADGEAVVHLTNTGDLDITVTVTADGAPIASDVLVPGRHHQRRPRRGHPRHDRRPDRGLPRHRRRLRQRRPLLHPRLRDTAEAARLSCAIRAPPEALPEFTNVGGGRGDRDRDPRQGRRSTASSSRPAPRLTPRSCGPTTTPRTVPRHIAPPAPAATTPAISSSIATARPADDDVAADDGIGAGHPHHPPGRHRAPSPAPAPTSARGWPSALA